MNVKDTVLTLFTNTFDDTLKDDRLPHIIASTANKMKTICGDSLYAEYKKLPADYTVSDVSYVESGIIELTIGSHSFEAGEYIYFTGDNENYIGDCIIDSVTTTTVKVYYAFDGITLPVDFPTTLPSADDLYIVGSKKYDLITAESYLVLYNLTINLEQLQDSKPYATSTDFGEGTITVDSFANLENRRNQFMKEARQLIGKYYVDDDNSSFSVKYGSLAGDNTWQTS